MLRDPVLASYNHAVRMLQGAASVMDSPGSRNLPEAAEPADAGQVLPSQCSRSLPLCMLWAPTCPSVRDLSILMAHLFLGGAPSLLPYVPRLLLEVLSFPETHLDIPFFEATCHRERPGLWHLLYLLCRLTCFFRPVAVQATVVADTFGIFSHFWQGSPPRPPLPP